MIKRNLMRGFDSARKIVSLIRFSPFDVDSVEGRSFERYRKIILSSATNLLAKAAVSLIGLVSVPLTIHYLGSDNYGLWMIITSLVVWLQLSDFGIGNGIVNLISEANGKNDHDAARSHIYSSLVLLTGAVVVLFFPVIVLVNSLNWGSILKISNPETIQTAKACFNVVAGLFIIGMPFSISSRVLVAYQSGYLVNVMQILSSVIGLVGLILSVSFKLDLVWFSVLASIGTLIVNAIMMVLVFKRYKIDPLSVALFSKSSVNKLMKIGLPFFLFQIGALVINNFTNVIISRKLDLVAVADFNVYNKLYLLFFFVGTSISIPFYPAIREAFERRDFSWVKKSIRRVVVLRAISVCAVSIPFIFLGNTIVRLWTRNAVADLSSGGWGIIVFCLVFISIASTLSEIMLYSDVIWVQIIITFITAVLMIISMNVLIPLIGFIGVYVSFIIANLHSMIWGFVTVSKYIRQGR